MAKVFTKTYGCTLNHSDTEVMRGILEEQGHTLVKTEEEAEVILVNSCTVKGATEKSLFRYLDEHKGRRIVVAGCVPQSQPSRLKEYCQIGTTQLASVGSAVKAAIEGEITHNIQRRVQPRLSLPKRRVNEGIEIIPINDGCLGACTFCATKFARGSLRSYSQQDILRQIEAAIKDGVKEIWFTSPDTACYGFDIGTSLPELAKKACAIHGEFRIRAGMGNPDHFITYADELAEMFLEKKMFSFLHIPVQCGSDKVLKEMKRNYEVNTFKTIIRKVREKVPEITIATDIIVGFPGETDEEFMETINLIKEVRPNVINISRFTARPGTPASRRKDQVHGRVIKERSRIVTEIFQKIALEENEKHIGKKCRVLVEQKGKNWTMVARTDSYKQVILRSGKIGEFKEVIITGATEWDLRAENSF